MAAGGRLLAAWLLALATTTTTTATTGVAGSQTPEVGEQTTSTTATATATATNRSQPLEGFEAGPLPAAVASFPLYMRLLATVACLVIFTVGVCGNLLVALVVIKTKYLRNSTNLFLINLSVADLLVLIVCMPTVLIELHSRPETWPLGETMCKMSNFVEMLAANGSIFTILAISFERYYAICKPLKAGYKCTRLRATIIICIIWLLSSILTSPILVMAKFFDTKYIDGSTVFSCILETDTFWHRMYVFVSMFAFFCLPLLVLMLVYWQISRRLICETAGLAPGSAHCSTGPLATASTTRPNLTTTSGLLSSGWPNQPGAGPEQASGETSDVVALKRQKGLRKAASLRPVSNLLGSIQAHRQNSYRRQHQHHHRRDITQILAGASPKPSEVRVVQGQANEVITTTTRLAPATSDKRARLVAAKVVSLDHHHHQHGLLSGAEAQESRLTCSSDFLDNKAALGGPLKGPQVGPSSRRLLGRLFDWSKANNISHSVAQMETANAGPRSICRQGRQANGLRVTTSPDPPRRVLGGRRRADDSEKTEAKNGLRKLANQAQEAKDELAGLGVGGKSRAPLGPETCGEPQAGNDDQCRAPFLAAEGATGPAAAVAGEDEQPIDGSSKSNSRHLHHEDRNRFSRRPLESRKAASRHNGNVESKFRAWTKGFSLSSSDGSSHCTTSTMLVSERSSIAVPTGSSPPPAPSSNQTNEAQQLASLLLLKNHSMNQRMSHGLGSTSTTRSSTPSSRRAMIYCSPKGSPGRGGGGEKVACGRPRSASERQRFGRMSNGSQWPEEEVEEEEPIEGSVSTSGLGEQTPSSSSPSSSAGLNGASLSVTPPSSELSKTASSSPASMMGRQGSRGNNPEGAARAKQEERRSASVASILATASQGDHLESSSTTPGPAGAMSCDVKAPLLRPTEPAHLFGAASDGAKDSNNNNDNEAEAEGAREETWSQAGFRRSSRLEESGGGIDSSSPAGIVKRASLVLASTIRALHRNSAQANCDRAPGSAEPDEGGQRERRKWEPAAARSSQLVLMAQMSYDQNARRAGGLRSGSHPAVSGGHLHQSASNGACSHNHHHHHHHHHHRPDFFLVRDISKKQQMDSRRQVVIMLAFVVACFFLLFFPYRVFTLWLILSTEDQVQSLGMETYYNLTYFSRILIYLHSAINPIAYNLISTKFRRASMSILLCRGSASRRHFTTDHHNQHHHHQHRILNQTDSNMRALNSPTSIGIKKQSLPPPTITIVTNSK